MPSSGREAAERMARLRSDRRERGVCIDCGGPLDDFYTRCAGCRDYHARWLREHRKAKAR